MIRFDPIWTIACDELRLTRRTFRYWAFAGSSWLLGLIAWLYYSALHGFLSAYSGTIALIGPHYLFAAVGFYFLAAFMFGVAFLGFDIRARDQREGIVEVLDARPISNLELIAGRWLGLSIAAWLPVAALAVVAAALGWLLLALGAPLGDTPEPHSLLAFALFMAIPAIAFSFALVFAITLLVRHRLLAAVLSLAALYGLFASMIVTTPVTAALVDYIGITQLGASSDFVPSIARDLWGWVQRGGVLVAAFGLIGIAAAIHPRLDDGRRSVRFGASAVVLAAGLVLIGMTGTARQRQIDQLDRWAAAHQAHAGEPAPDLVAIRGSIAIVPGDSLDGSLSIEFRAPKEAPLERALFTLNPGLEVRGVTANDGGAITFTHADGLLELRLPRPLAAGEAIAISLNYRGRPQTAFGYLDSSVMVEHGNLTNSSVGLLGAERGIFDRRYVALLPGIGWLPLPGADFGRDDPRVRPRDFFLVDLEVDLPEGWLPAGPGRREDRAGAPAGQSRYGFAPGIPVPEVALLAARFDSRKAEIEGVTVELLTHPGHRRAIGAFDASGPRIREWAADTLRLARDEGLAYPFAALTLVETPFNLRSFRGGWQLDLASGPPGLILLRECGLPTARFDVLFRREKEPPDAAMVLSRFFSNDFSAGNALVAGARSFFTHQTGAGGREALALDFAMDELATLALMDTRSYFSAHLYDAGFNARISQVAQQYSDRRPRSLTLADVMLQTFASRPEVWDRVLSSSLLDLAPRENPRQTLDILSLKAGALAQLLHDELGAAGSKRLLGTLAEAHRGGNYTIDDFIAALDATGFDGARTLVDDWLVSTRLPGFIAAPVELYRIADDGFGNPQFQLKVRVRNDEPVPGTIRVSWVESTRADDQVDSNQMRVVPGELFRVPGNSAIEYAAVLAKKPISVWIEPSLSLNRGAFVAYADYDSTAVAKVARRDEPAQRGVTPIGWTADERGIVVDDLDQGFAIVRDAEPSGTRLGRDAAATGDLDQGLPRVSERMTPNRWSRAETPNGWGKYRHTIAYLRPGEGTTRAAFTTTLPQAGRWRLELHLPNLVFNNGITTWGRWNLTLNGGGAQQKIAFDTAGGVAGWNEIGEYELAAGEVTVSLSDQGDGRLVVADAIRWLPRSAATTTNEP